MAIMSCTCQHEFQDEQYGKNMRVFNEMKKTQSHPNSARCTVCGAIKNVVQTVTVEDKSHGKRK